MMNVVWSSLLIGVLGLKDFYNTLIELIHLLSYTYISRNLNPPLLKKVVCIPFQDSPLLFMWPPELHLFTLSILRVARNQVWYKLLFFYNLYQLSQTYNFLDKVWKNYRFCYIQYLIIFWEKSVIVLIDLDSKVNIIYSIFAKELGFSTRLINVKAQKLMISC